MAVCETNEIAHSWKLLANEPTSSHKGKSKKQKMTWIPGCHIIYTHVSGYLEHKPSHNAICLLTVYLKKKKNRTCRIGGDAILDEAGELLLVSILVILHQEAHVLWHVDAHDVLAVDLSVELLALWIITREALGAGGR